MLFRLSFVPFEFCCCFYCCLKHFFFIMAPRNRDNPIRAKTLLQEGRSQQYVANLLGVNQSTLSRLARRLRETGDVRRRPGQGRKRADLARDDRFLTLNSLRDRTLTAIKFQGMLDDTTRGAQVSKRTVRRRLGKVDLRARCPARCPILSSSCALEN
ncbi:hypothetical protein ILUMI_21724 [Ignelater luminosus]|uniref:Transposase Tc1-like domain-containing protein n=1 Tax=Ignelater luminosus TaxID=2038154 RepID=A0A8K0G3L3_IGNLU|nr:hypothetical protein ILUMI_21724 [Ignelater luminosus]